MQVLERHNLHFTLISHMSRSVLDLGLQPTKRAKAQADRRQRKSEEQTKAQAANQLESAQRLQSSLAPPSNPDPKPLGLQEIGQMFDQETERMWEIDLRQRGLVDGTTTRDQLSQLHHELFRVNQCRILDRYWRRAGQKISQKANGRDIARKYFRMKIYKRCKGWFKSENSTTYLKSRTDLGSAQLQCRGISGMPHSTVDLSKDECLSYAHWQYKTMPLGSLDTYHFCDGQGMMNARYWTQSQLGRTSESLPDIRDPGYYEEPCSVQSELWKASINPPDNLCVSSDKEASCTQLQLMGDLEGLADTINNDIRLPPTFAHTWTHHSFSIPMQRATAQEQSHDSYTGQCNTFDGHYEQTSSSYPNHVMLSSLSSPSQDLSTEFFSHAA